MTTNLWLIEGIPGAGKTSLAKSLAEQQSSKGLPTRWWLEEDRNHPVFPAALRKQSAASDFPDLCLKAFARFIAAEDGDLILEGSAFQSTVRFMFANARAASEIDDYVDRWCRVVEPAHTRLVYLTIGKPRLHYEGLDRVRGADWTRKLIAYVERTPVARSMGWSGFAGFVAFWETYQDLCLHLLDRMTIPVLHLSAKLGGPEHLRQAALSHFIASS